MQGLRDKWYVDSGATAHMSNNKSMFSDLEKSVSKKSVSVGNGKEASVSGIGLIREKVAFDDACVPVQMKEALHIPDLMCNLISVSRLRKAGFTILFDTDNFGEETCTVTRQGSSEILFKAYECTDGLYEVELQAEKPVSPKAFEVSEQQAK